MNTYDDKWQEKKSQSVANADFQKRNDSTSTYQFVDNRPEAVAQRKSQEMANNSQQAKKMVQLQSIVNNNASQQQPIQLREVHRISSATTPYIHEFTEEAIGQGAPSSLTYLINKDSTVYVQDVPGRIYPIESIDKEKIGTEYFSIDLHSLNRKKALSRGLQLGGKSKRYVDGLSRDEYPYASTHEGGTDSFWAYVPKAEQRIQGGQLSGLYRRVIDSGDPEFDVELD